MATDALYLEEHGVLVEANSLWVLERRQGSEWDLCFLVRDISSLSLPSAPRLSSVSLRVKVWCGSGHTCKICHIWFCFPTLRMLHF